MVSLLIVSGLGHSFWYWWRKYVIILSETFYMIYTSSKGKSSYKYMRHWPPCHHQSALGGERVESSCLGKIAGNLNATYGIDDNLPVQKHNDGILHYSHEHETYSKSINALNVNSWEELTAMRLGDAYGGYIGTSYWPACIFVEACALL